MAVSVNQIIKNSLEQIQQTNESYWDFKKDDARDYVHGMYTYPAMMVPRMQRTLIKTIIEARPDIERILDPFVGAGTVMVEAMLQGLSGFGIDINPLAVLAAQVKTKPLNIDMINNSLDSFKRRVSSVTNIKPHIFDGREKWFRQDIAEQLDTLRLVIEQEQELDMRKFFAVAFCQTVRDVCNSRNSTYKLHIKDQRSIETLNKNPLDLFNTRVLEYSSQMKLFCECLELKGLLKHENEKLLYRNSTDIYQGDAKNSNYGGDKFNLVVTSPPYGDNVTTITYGQFSILQLRWLEGINIGINYDNNLIKTLSEIDSSSLGGRVRERNVEKGDQLLSRSDTLIGNYNYLAKLDARKAIKFYNFFKDFDKSLNNIANHVRDEGYVLMTVGNRWVLSRKVQFNQIVQELGREYGLQVIVDIKRSIGKKRMAEQNAERGKKGKLKKTIKEEHLLLLQKTN